MTADLRHLEAFLAIARTGSFTRAAVDLHVSQPALTVQIRQLESRLGVRLFDRNNRHVALTPLGRDMVAPLERVLLDLRAIVDGAHEAAAYRRGVVTVACLPSIAADVLPQAIARLGAQHEGLVVRVRDGVAARVVDLVKSGEADFGVTCWGRVDRELVERPLFADRLSAFVRRGHRLADRRHVTLRELVGFPLIVTDKDSSVRELLDRTLAREILPVQVAHEVTYMTTALGMAAAGLGVAILPDGAIASAPRTIFRVPIRTPVLQRQIGILTKVGRSLQPAAQKLLAVLESVAPARRMPSLLAPR